MTLRASSNACYKKLLPPPSPPPLPPTLPAFPHQCHHLLPFSQCQVSSENNLSPHSDISQLIHVFARDLICLKLHQGELSYCNLFQKHLSLLLPLLSLCLLPPLLLPLPLMPAHCSHLWRHGLIFPPSKTESPRE